MKSLNVNQIKEILPHRYPMLLVDRVLDWEKGKKITTLKNITANEEFFNGHFPHQPVMPGVLMIEAMAQSAALLVFLSLDWKFDENTMVYFATIDRARFKRPVEPGDQLIMEAEFIRSARGMYKVKATGTVDGNVAVEAELMCAIRHTANQADES